MNPQPESLPEQHEFTYQADALRSGELDLFAIFLVLRAHRWRIASFAVVAFLLMVAFTLLVKPRYSSVASMLVPQQTNSAAAMALQAATGADLIGGGNEIYLDILKSRAIADRLVERFRLKEHYHVAEVVKAETILASRTVMSSSKEGLIRVTVEDEDPHVAADLANTYLAELDSENQQLAIGAASQQRRFYEQEMIKEKNALADAEVALKQTEEKTGVQEPTAQVQANIGATETTRALLRSRQVQLAALLQGETSANPEVVRLRAEIDGLEGQLQALESQGGPSAGTPSTKNPEKVLIYVRNLREVKFHETLFELLARQFATAKEQEAKNVSMIEILDKATPSEHKSWPPRTLYCIAAFFFGGLCGVFYTALAEVVRAVILNPENRALYRASVKNGATGSQTL